MTHVTLTRFTHLQSSSHTAGQLSTTLLFELFVGSATSIDAITAEARLTLTWKSFQPQT